MHTFEADYTANFKPPFGARRYKFLELRAIKSDELREVKES
jgi:hypothetical protein